MYTGLNTKSNDSKKDLIMINREEFNGLQQQNDRLKKQLGEIDTRISQELRSLKRELRSKGVIS